MIQEISSGTRSVGYWPREDVTILASGRAASRKDSDWARTGRMASDPRPSDAVVAIQGEERSTTKEAAVVPPICMPRALGKVKVGLRQKRRVEKGVVGGYDLAVREAREHAKWTGRLVAVVEAQAPLEARPAVCLPWRVLLVVRKEDDSPWCPNVREFPDGAIVAHKVVELNL